MNPALKRTKNYNLFELHQFNRDVRRLPRLEKSMEKYGFIPHKAISCVQNGYGKLTVTDGHHRLVAAKKVGVPVWYVLAEDPGITIQEEQMTTRSWDLKDYLTSYVRNGYSAYIAVEQYMEETGISIGIALSVCAGQSAGSGNKSQAFKAGTYKLGDQIHANQLKSIILLMKTYNIPFASNSLFVRALSKALRVDDFLVDRFKSKIKSHAQHFEKQSDLISYLKEIERIYNRQSKERLPVEFLAIEKSKQRQREFYLEDSNKQTNF